MTAEPGKLSVLFIEDHDDARELYQLAFEGMGYTVDVAGESASGLALAQSGAHDVIVIDIGLPGLDGYALAGALTAAPPPRPRLLVSVTGFSSAEDRAKALAAGFDLHVAKPIDLNDLEQRIRACFEAKAKAVHP